MVPPKTNFLFSNLGLIMAQEISIPVYCFMGGGGNGTPSAVLSQKCILWGEGPGKTPALRCLSYLVNSFLTDIKHLTKN